MSNALYYTFSTIAQTLAGAMALLAAFLLYRLQVLNRAIDSDAERISSALKPYHGRADEMLRSQEYVALLRAAEKGYFPQGNPPVQQERERLTRLLHTKKSLMRRFKIALYLTAGLITFSIVALVATPQIMSSLALTYTIFALGLLGFVACMLSYIAVLQSAFD